MKPMTKKQHRILQSGSLFAITVNILALPFFNVATTMIGVIASSLILLLALLSILKPQKQL